MKFCVAVLLLSSLYLASCQNETVNETVTVTETVNETVTEILNPWVRVRQSLANNNPFSDQLDDIGSRNNLGQAADSRLFVARQGEAENSFNSWLQAANGSAVNYSAEVPLRLGDIRADSEYQIRIDPETGAREIIGWSLQTLNARNNSPYGTNITYHVGSGNVVVTEFEGINQWVAYQLGNASLLNVTTYDSLRDYHHNYIGYEEHDPATYTADEVLDNAFNNAISGLDDSTALENIEVTNVRTVDSYIDNNGAIWVRVDADITTDTDSGEIVTVTSCERGSNCSDGNLEYWWWKSVILAPQE